MSRYDGLIIPRSYSEYINKTDAATLLQALQLSGVMDNAPTANSNHPTKSGGVFDALATKQNALTFDDAPTAGSNNPVKSSGIKTALDDLNKFRIGEVKTGATWIDGKPIYRKGIGGLFGGGTGSWNTTGATIANVASLVRGWGCRTTDKTVINSMSFQMQGDTVYYFNPPNAAFANTNLIFIEYTKTTD